jgi:hypothetical protein
VVAHPTSDLLLVELAGRREDFCKLLEPIPLAEGSSPEVGTLVELAGLGLDEDGGHGKRRFAAETVVDLPGDGAEIVVDGLGRTGACTGDSGGPLLVRASDGTVRVAGVLTAGSADCVGRDRYLRVDRADAFFAALPAERCGSQGCGRLDARGRCFARTAVWCESAELRGMACETSSRCGWDDSAAGYRCVPPESACAGVDAFGRCNGSVTERCDAGALLSEDCSATGATCVRDATGRALCGPRTEVGPTP